MRNKRIRDLQSKLGLVKVGKAIAILFMLTAVSGISWSLIVDTHRELVACISVICVGISLMFTIIVNRHKYLLDTEIEIEKWRDEVERQERRDIY